MADTKPLGSEKLSNDEKLKRILELTYYKTNQKNSNKNKIELVKESKTNGVYGIVKEKDGYYVKKGINESSLDYIGGMFMKNKNRFSSYSEAFKRLELLKGQEELQEATKYVLKQKPKTEDVSLPPTLGGESADASLPPSTPDMGGDTSSDTNIPPSPNGDMSPDMGSEMDDTGSMGGGESKRSDYMAEIQKYAGKLGQELRDQKERMEGDDIKYVLNMVISAVDLDKLEIEDLEEIGKKFEREDEVEKMSDEEPVKDKSPNTKEPTVDSEPPQEMSEYEDAMGKLESFESWDVNEMDDDYMREELAEYDEDVVELDLDEIKNNVNKSVNNILNKYFNKI